MITVRHLVLSVLLLALAAPAAAHGEAFAPPDGKVLNGLTAGYDFDDFTRRAGKAPAVWQHFVSWNGSLDYTVDNSRKAGARLMYHLGTAGGQNMPERISPGEIARGKGDGYLIRLTRTIAGYGRPAYVRLMGEMNNCDNAYASHSCSGARRDPDHSPATFKKAWKRVYLIMHGGDVAAIDAKLAARGLPAVQSGARRDPRGAGGVRLGADGGRLAEHRGARARAVLARDPLGRLGRHELLLPLPELDRAERLLPDLGGGQAQAVRVRGVGDVGRRHALLRRAAVRLDRRRTSGRRWSSTTRASPRPGTFRLANYPASARVIKRRLAAKRYLSTAP